jgi:hypothetical protein
MLNGRGSTVPSSMSEDIFCGTKIGGMSQSPIFTIKYYVQAHVKYFTLVISICQGPIIFNPLKHGGYYMYHLLVCSLPTDYIYGFHMILTINMAVFLSSICHMVFVMETKFVLYEM